MRDNDLISRSALLDRLSYYISHSTGGNQYAFTCAAKEVRNAPAVSAAPGWISVDDGLPEPEKWVAVWYMDKDGDFFPTMGKLCEYAGKACWATDVDDNPRAWPPVKITHWMPLPEPPITKEG